jgi:hypothetical protein
MEASVQSAAANQDQPAGQNRTTLPEDSPPIQSESARMSEEMRMLLTGFGTGLAIAGIFLVWVVLTYANWIP